MTLGRFLWFCHRSLVPQQTIGRGAGADASSGAQRRAPAQVQVSVPPRYNVPLSFTPQVAQPMAGGNSKPAEAGAGLGVSSIIGAAHSDGPHNNPPVPLEITDQEADQAFDFFDVSGKGTLSQADLKARLSIFYKNLPDKEYDLLIPEPNFNKQVRPAAAQSARQVVSPDSLCFLRPGCRCCAPSSRTIRSVRTTQYAMPLPSTTLTGRDSPTPRP